jgi:Rhodopirellula transposase DDE domain
MRRCATSSALSGLSAWMSENDACITYEKGIKVTKAEMATLNLHSDVFHPEWNYPIKPRPPT